MRRLDGLLQGDYRTLFRGFGLDLADLREYQYGDDVRHIDWNVTARLQTPYVREYHEDREVTAWFLLDLSPSVDFGSGEVRKRNVSADFVAVLARLLTRHGNRVGALFYGEEVDRMVPARSGRRHVLQLLHAMLARPEPQRNLPTDLGELLLDDDRRGREEGVLRPGGDGGREAVRIAGIGQELTRQLGVGSRNLDIERRPEARREEDGRRRTVAEDGGAEHGLAVDSGGDRLPHLGLGQITQRKDRPCQLVLAQPVQEVALVLVGIGSGQKSVAPTTCGVGILQRVNSGVVACRHRVAFELAQGSAQQRPELDVRVAVDARARRAALEVVVEERLHDARSELALEVEHVERDPQLGRHAAGVVGGVE